MYPWTREADGTYTSEASLLTAHNNWTCPKCGASPPLTAHRDRDNDITHWDTGCLCGARLVIFND
jgi:ribosomal protein S27AE